MTKEEAIKWLNVERQLIVEVPQDNSKELKEAYDMAIQALEKNIEKEPVQAHTRWIPVSERLPEEYNHVLCQFCMGGMAECYYAHNFFHVVGGLRVNSDEVIAWQPLPQPYKAGSEDEE